MTAFDFSVLSEFRDRLVAGGLERKILDLLPGRLKGLGLVRAGGRQRTDSTHVLAAIRGMNRVELAGETVRAALEALAAAAPDWLAGVIDASWQQVYGQRIDTLRLPASETARSKLAGQYGRDGYHLLEAVRAPGAPGGLRELPGRLARVDAYLRPPRAPPPRRPADPVRSRRRLAVQPVGHQPARRAAGLAR